MIEQSKEKYQLPEEEGIDIKKYVFLILSHWWWFAIALVFSLTIAYLINRYSQNIYSASCSIILGESDSRVGSVENILDELARARGKKRKAIVENEISILKSYKMSRLALQELEFEVTYIAVGRRNIAESQLYKNCPFYVLADESKPYKPIGTFNIYILSPEKYRLSFEDGNTRTLLFGEKFQQELYGFEVHLSDPDNFVYQQQLSNKYYFSFNDINNQSKAFSNSLGVEVNAEKGSILTLSMSGFVPEQITDYLNKLCEVYIKTNLKEKNLASDNTIQFIDEQLNGVVDSLEVTGLRLQQFRSANKVINLSKEGAFLFEKMQELQSEKAGLDIKDRYYGYLLNYIQRKVDFSDVVAPSVVGIQDMLLNNLVAELNALNLERRNLSLTVLDNSPQVAVLNNKIVNTRNALQENLNSLIEGNNIAIIELDERINKIETEVKKLPSTERQLINIEREFSINDQIYTFLLEKRAEAGITRASNTSDHKILDIARPENASKIKPKTSTNYMIALAAGGIIPLILLLIIDFFNTKITDRKYLELNLEVPIIGNIGHNEDSSELPVNENPRSSLSESFRAMRTNLQFVLKDERAKVLAISSAVSGEGKTFVSVNLASILAMANKKVLLVSLDLRRPKVHNIFNLPNDSGMTTYLIGKNTFEETICKTNINNLHISASGPIPPNPSELLSSQKMSEFIEHARKIYDYIILDTPPVAIVTDMLTLKELIDAFIFVIRHNYSDKQVIDLANSIYQKHLIKNIGVVVNDIQVKGYYGYSYRYGYGYGYGYSYSSKEPYYDDKARPEGISKLFRKLFN